MTKRTITAVASILFLLQNCALAMACDIHCLQNRSGSHHHAMGHTEAPGEANSHMHHGMDMSSSSVSMGTSSHTRCDGQASAGCSQNVNHCNQIGMSVPHFKVEGNKSNDQISHLKVTTRPVTAELEFFQVPLVVDDSSPGSPSAPITLRI